MQMQWKEIIYFSITYVVNWKVIILPKEKRCLTLQGCVLLVGFSRGLWKLAQSCLKSPSGKVTYRKCPEITPSRKIVKTNKQPDKHLWSGEPKCSWPAAVFLEWSLPGPSLLEEMLIWLVLNHLSEDRVLRSQSHRPSSKSQRWKSSAVQTHKHHVWTFCIFLYFIYIYLLDFYIKVYVPVWPLYFFSSIATPVGDPLGQLDFKNLLRQISMQNAI